MNAEINGKGYDRVALSVCGAIDRDILIGTLPTDAVIVAFGRACHKIAQL